MQDLWGTVASVVVSVSVPVLLVMAWQAVALLKARGYRTTYAEALLRATGAAANAAQDAGTNLFTPAGRAVGMVAAVKYMENTVPEASAALGIDMTGHAQRVSAQIGATVAEAHAMLAAGLVPDKPAS